MEDKEFVISKNRIITRKELFSEKERFHKEQAKLPFEEKITIVIKLQEMAKCIKGDTKERMLWKI